MEPSKEAINVRICRLSNQLWGRGAASLLGAETSGKRALTREALLDTLTVLYDECNKDSVKKADDYVPKFIDQYRSILSELKQLRVNIYDFEIKDLIGRGHFGEVHVVRERHTGDVYAMKTLKKETTLKHINIAFFEEERDIMAISRSDWLIKLQYAFQDTTQLYLIMEYCPGGDLAGLLDRMGKPLKESDAIFYIAELIQALKELHSLGFVHRDVKPDNVLFDRCGHLKLGDFGSAARLSTLGKMKVSMPIGTTDYIAPEILMGLENPQKFSHDTPCDYWSLGIVAYELVTFRTPFKSSDNKSVVHTYNSIIEHGNNKNAVPIKYPNEYKDCISDQFKELVQNLLHPIAVKRPNRTNVHRYKALSNIVWDSLRKQVPPFVPIVNAQDDTSNFTEIEKQKSTVNIDNFRNKSNFSGKNLPFIGFTYTPDVGLSQSDDQESDGCSKISASNCSSESGSTVSGFLNSSINGTAFCLSNFREIEGLAESRKKEIESLHKELATLKSKRSFTNDKEKRLLETENQRTQLEKDLTEITCLNQKLRNQLELEHKSRQILETKSLQLIRSAKKKWKDRTEEQVNALNKVISQYEMEHNESKESIRRLESQLHSATIDLTNSSSELETLKKLQHSHKDSMAKARRLSRQSIVGIEQMSQENSVQLQNLTQNLRKEIELKSSIEAELKKCLNNLKISEERENNLLTNLRRDKDLYMKELNLLTNKYDDKCEELSDVRIKMIELEDKNLKLQQKERQYLEHEKEVKNDIQFSQRNSDLKTVELENKIISLQSSIRALESECEEKNNLNSVLFGEKINIQAALERALSCEEKHRERVTILEDLVGKLQENVSLLENMKDELTMRVSNCDDSPMSPRNIAYSERINVMQEQINQLDEKLKVSREETLLHKQEARKANSALWKKEKELSDCDLDRRIATRELKEAEGKIINLQEQLKNIASAHETSMKELQESLKEKTSDIENLQKTINTLNFKLSESDKKLKSIETDAAKSSKTIALSEQKMTFEIQNLKEKIDKLESDLELSNERRSKIEALIEKRQAELKHCEAEKSSEKEQRIRLEVMLHGKNKDCDNLHTNYKALQEACTLLEEQLIDFEKVTEVLESSNVQLKNEVSALRTEINELNTNCLKDKKLIDVHKFSSISSDVKNKELHQKLIDKQSKNSELEKQINDILNRESSMSTEINERGIDIAQLESKLKQSTSEIRALQTELHSLKEECTRLLTDGAALREDNMRVHCELKEHKENNAALRTMIAEREEELSAHQFHWQQRDLKAEATIAQQIKLIDFLQFKVEGAAKRKKTLGDMIFGKSTKENVPPLTPQTPLNNRISVNDQSKELLREKQKNRELMEQLSILQNKCKTTDDKDIIKKTTIDEVDTKFTSSPEKMLMEGGVKIQRGVILARVHMKLFTSHIEWVTEKDGIKGQLQLLEGCTKLSKDLTIENIDIILSDCEKRFGFKIVVSSDTTCWPSQTLVVICSSAHQKDNWITHFESISAVTCSSITQTTSTLNKPLLQFRQNLFDPNCVLEMEKNFILIGADSGLYCSTQTVSKKDPILIKNTCGIMKADMSSNIDKIILLNTEGQLIYYSLRQFSAVIKSIALTSNQSLVLPAFQRINMKDPNDPTEDSLCNIFEISHPKDETAFVYLCAATSTKLVIFKYDFLKMAFISLRCMKTEAITCMKFSEHSVIVGSHKFFEIELKNFYIEEFLDASDTTLAHAVHGHKKNIFPIAILQTKSMENDKSIEYLMCYSGFGIFVDEYGQRTRQADVKWSHLPLQIVYRKPFIFVVHLASIEIIHLKNEYYQKSQGSDSDSINSVSSNCLINTPDKLTLQFNSLRYLGKSISTGSVYIMQLLQKSNGNLIEILELNGNNAFKKQLGESLETLDNIDDAESSGDLKNNVDISFDDTASNLTEDSSAEARTDFAANIREKAKLINSLKRENDKVTSIQKMLSKRNKNEKDSDGSEDESDLSTSYIENNSNEPTSNSNSSNNGYMCMNKNSASSKNTAKSATDICNDMFITKQVRFN